ncbi:hypothetical protein BA891_01160 [Vibrio natriegens]|nr:hypothetical protein BA891_01160 [Vibrio natriegens]
MLSVKGERIRGVALNYLSLIARNLIGILIIPFIVSNVGTSSYGVYALVGSIVGYLVIIELGLANTAVRFISKYKSTRDYYNLSKFLGHCIVLYSGCILVANVLAYFMYLNIDNYFVNSLNNNEIELFKEMFIILVVNISLTLAGNTITGIIVAEEKFVYLKVLDLSMLIIRTIFIVLGFNYFNIDIVGVVFIDTGLNAIAIIFRYVYVVKKIPIRPIFSGDSKLLKEVLIYGFFISLNVIVNQVNWRLDSFIIGSNLSSEAVAVFSVGLQFVLAFIAVGSAATNIFLPKMVKLVENNSGVKALSEEMNRIGRFQIVILSIVLINYSLTGNYIISFLFGPEFDMAFYTSLVVMIPFSFVLAMSVSNCILQAMNKHAFKSCLLFILAPINVLISIFMIESFGIIGAPLGTAICLVFGELFLMGIYLGKNIQLSLQDLWLSFLKISCLAIGFYFSYSIIGLEISGWSKLILHSFAITSSFFIVLWLFFFNSNEKKFIGGLFLKFFWKKYSTV